MISSRIDLTENRDFSGGLGRLSDFIMNTSLSPEDFNRVRALQNSMSTEEFYLLEQFEKIFGKIHQDNDFYNVFKFKNDEHKFRYERSSYCARCGKWLFPWLRKTDMNTCPDCDEIMDGRLPWKRQQDSWNREIDDRDILNMR